MGKGDPLRALRAVEHQVAFESRTAGRLDGEVVLPHDQFTALDPVERLAILFGLDYDPRPLEFVLFLLRGVPSGAPPKLDDHDGAEQREHCLHGKPPEMCLRCAATSE